MLFTAKGNCSHDRRCPRQETRLMLSLLLTLAAVRKQIEGAHAQLALLAS